MVHAGSQALVILDRVLGPDPETWRNPRGHKIFLGQARQEAGTGMRTQPGLEGAHLSFYANMEMISPPGGIGLRRGAESEQSVWFKNPHESHIKIKEHQTHKPILPGK